LFAGTNVETPSLMPILAPHNEETPTTKFEEVYVDEVVADKYINDPTPLD
jgi:hypothetical protein